MNFFLTGGGMKLSYQVGQVDALLSNGVVPSTIYCVSSGIVTAALMLEAAHRCGSVRAKYQSLLMGIACEGLLPPLATCRSAAAKFIVETCGVSIKAGTPAVAMGAHRSAYTPILLDLRDCIDLTTLEALMSIPLIADSHASRELGIVDGGLHANVVTHIVPPAESAVVLSHFKPKETYPASFSSMPLQRMLSHKLTRRMYRLIWAWINTTFPHLHGRENTEWFYPCAPHGLNFYSRSLEKHMEAMQRGFEETLADLNGRAHLCQLRNASTRIESERVPKWVNDVTTTEF